MKSSTVGFYNYQRQSVQEWLNIGLFISQEMALFWKVHIINWVLDKIISILNINNLTILWLDYLYMIFVEEQSIYDTTYASILSLCLMKLF